MKNQPNKKHRSPSGKLRTGLLNSISKKIPNGIYGTHIKEFVTSLQFFSVNYHFKECVKKKLNPDKDISKIKTPPWASELYQILALLIALILLILVAIDLPIAPIWAAAIVFISLYRPIEIMIFITNWIFVTSDEPHSYKRSVAGFLVNLIEIVLFFSVAQLVIGCYEKNQYWMLFIQISEQL